MEIDPARLSLLADLQTSAGRDAVGDLLRAFVDDMRHGLAQMRDQAQAGERAALKGLAHKMKGSSGMIGASRLADLIERVESAAPDPTCNVQDLIAAAERALEAVVVELAEWRGQQR